MRFSALDELVQRFLLQVTKPETYALHDLMRESFGQMLAGREDSDALKRLYCREMVNLARDMPYGPTLADIEAFSPRIPHIVEVGTTLQNWLSEEDLTFPYICLGRFYEGQSAFEQAQQWYEQCLNICQERLGDAHPDVASSLNNLAALYDHQGRYSEAEPLYQQALAMCQRLLGDEHPYVALSLNNLALLYNNQGRYNEADPLYQQALAMTQRLLGDAHPEVARSLNNLAMLYNNQGRYSEAESLFQQALALCQRLLGEAHPNTTLVRNNLDSLRTKMNQAKEL